MELTSGGGCVPSVVEPVQGGSVSPGGEVVCVLGNQTPEVVPVLYSDDPLVPPVELDDGGAEVLGRPDVLSVDVGGCSDGPVVVGG